MLIVVFGLLVAWWPGEARQISNPCLNFTRPEHRFGQLFHVKVQPPPAQDRALRGQHRVDHGVYDFSLLCADGIPLLMEDHKPRPCQPRPWLKEQKCPTGFWCHEGQTEHSFYCCPSSRKFANRCHLPPAVGYGKQRMRRFYFDWKTDACHELQYSGIGGNENSFMDYEQCEQVCRGAGEPPIMLPSNMKIMPPETKETKRPEKEKKLVYPKEVAAPVSLRPPPPPTTKPTVEEVYYTVPSKTSRTAPPTTTRPTSVLTTPTPTTTTALASPEPEEIFDPNPCSLVPDKGSPGKMTISMWYYDATSSACSPFVYLGKGGNSNRFGTSEECIDTCGIGKPTRKSCELPPAIGNGPFNIPRFYFDKVTKKCERFFYSGKDGNDNRFYKKNKCERLCLRKKPKKKENIFEFTTTPSMPPVIYESTPMRIIQNLVPSTTTVPFPSVEETQSQMHTDPYVFTATEAPVRINPITVEPWVEVVQQETTAAFQWHTATPHPTLIYEPRGETFPTMAPPSTTTPNIVDHVFNSLMNTQQQKLVELVQVPVQETSEVPRKFSSHEKIPFGQVEQQPVPMTPYGSVQPTENQYGMKVEPYQGSEYNVPQFPPSIYLPQPAYPEVKSSQVQNATSSQASVPSSVPSPTASSLPAPDPLHNIEVGPIPPYVAQTPQPPVVFGSPNPYVGSIPQTSQSSVDSSSLPATPASPGPAPSPFFPVDPQPTHYVVPIPTLSPTAGPPLVPTTIAPLPTLLPPNITYVTSPLPSPLAPAPEASNASPCSRPMYGDATIMCETRPEICPMGTFCQIGQGQSICCPIMEEPPCEQAIEEGVGTSLLRRWYFDPATRLCQPFHYKGFKGNQNNFQTFDSCHRACGATNICGTLPPQMSIHTHLLSCNSDADCAFSHSCIQSTPHNLCCPTVAIVPPAQIQVAPMAPTLIEQPTNMVIDYVTPHPSNNLCEQPIDTGFGLMAEHRWGFTNGQCTSFLFGGQGGNMNNFLTRNDCVRTCQSPSAPALPSSQCSQPAASGHGEQYLSRYFYSPEYRQCLHFIYSGEQGNHNNFESLQECLETCVANGVKFSSLASNPMSMVPPPPMPSQVPMTFKPRNVCPQGDALITVDGTPIQCDPSKAAKCPGDHVCTPVGGEAYCCPSPMNFCLQNRPAISVCSGPDFEPVREIRFTYDPLADRCIRFSYQNCRGSSFTPSSSLNNFMSNSQCNRLCCNQGYNLVYKRRLLKAMVADDPLGDAE